MKRIVCFVLPLTIMLALASCGGQPTESAPSQIPTQETETPEPSAQPEAPSESPEAKTFDLVLAGRWEQVSKATVQNGDISFDMPSHISLLPDGTYFLPINDELPYTYYMEQGIEPLRATTENGILHLVDAAYRLSLDSGLASQEEIAKWAQVDITYELSDIKESAIASYRQKEWYEMYDNDLLTLHITGTQVDAEDPSLVYTIDTTYVYEKQYSTYAGGMLDDYLRPSLVGNWTDNVGNRWTFGYEKDDTGEYKFAFSAVSAADGKTYVGKGIQIWQNEKGEEGFLMEMEDDTKSPRYQIISCDGAVFHLVDEYGEELILTKGS